MDSDRKLVGRLERIRLERFEQGKKWDPKTTDADYAKAFREFGVDLDKLDPTEAGRQLRERSNTLELAFFLDDWTIVRREVLSHDNREENGAESWHRLIATARAADPDRWRDELRGLVGGSDRDAVKRLAANENALTAQPARSLLLLAQILEGHENMEQAEKVLKRAWRLRPDDFWICSQLARTSAKEAVRFASAAVALHPDNAWAHMALGDAMLPWREALQSQTTLIWGFTYSYPFQFGGIPTWHIRSKYLNSLSFDEAIEEYRVAVRIEPTEPHVRCVLGRALIQKDGALDEAITEYQRGLQIQPNSAELHWELALGLVLRNEVDLAIDQLRESIRCDSGNGEHHALLGDLLRKQGKREAAFAEFREALLHHFHSPEMIFAYLHDTGQFEDEVKVYHEMIHLHPEGSFWVTTIGGWLRSLGKTGEEIKFYHEASRVNSKVPDTHRLLAGALEKQGRFDEAITACRHALRLKSDIPEIHGHLAGLLERRGKLDEAKSEYAREIALLREALRRNPGDAGAHQSLAVALFNRGMWDEACKEVREASRIAPSSNPFGSVGNWCYSSGKVDQAIALFREAVRLRPVDAEAHNNLGYYLLDFGEADMALLEIRQALRLKPNSPDYLDSLGWALLAKGDLKGAMAPLREAIHLRGENPGAEPQSHLRHVERLSALEGRLDAILRGRDVPTDTDGRLDVAELCRVTRRFGVAARFYREAFQAKPALADDLDSQHRLHAAIAAAQAGTSPSQDKDTPPVDDAERTRWRAQALDWLRAEKDACAKIIEAEVVEQKANRPPDDGAQRLPLARKTLDILAHHRDLACVRDESRLKGFPPEERPAWQAFWAEVDALRKRAQGDRP
jgi:tetratricopeptide (TPR) repeat protein